MTLTYQANLKVNLTVSCPHCNKVNELIKELDIVQDDEGETIIGFICQICKETIPIIIL